MVASQQMAAIGRVQVIIPCTIWMLKKKYTSLIEKEKSLMYDGLKPTCFVCESESYQKKTCLVFEGRRNTHKNKNQTTE